MEGVRRAEPADLQRIVELYRGLALELSEYRGRWSDLDAWPEPADELFASRIDDEGTCLLLGTIDGVAVGYLLAEVVTALPQAGHEPVGRIRDLYVEPPAREVGVGEALLSAAIEWLRERGVRSCDVSVLPGHRAAKNFCEQNGFVARSLTMHARW